MNREKYEMCRTQLSAIDSIRWETIADMLKDFRREFF